MIILDLALQGIKDISQSIRIRLQSGYNAIITGSQNPEALLSGLVALLFSEGYDPASADLVTPGAKNAGGGVTIMHPDGTTLRILKDLLTGATRLLEFQRDKKTFVEISTDSTEIAQLLRARMSLPTRGDYEKVFVLTAQELPSQNTQMNVAQLSLDDTFAEKKLEPEEIKVRIQQIDALLGQKRKVEDLEFELDGLQKQRFQIEDQITELGFDTALLDEIKQQQKRITYLDPMPSNFEQCYQSYREHIKHRKGDLKRWKTERDILERTYKLAPIDPLLTNWKLWANLAVGFISIVVAFVLGDFFRYIAFLDIPTLGWATFILYHNLSQREHRDHAKRRMVLSDKRYEKIMSQNQEEITQVEKVIEQTGLANPEEVSQAIKMRDALRFKLRDLETSQKNAETNPVLIKLRNELKQIKSQITILEDDLLTVGAVTIDGVALGNEKESLQMQLVDHDLNLESKKSEPVVITECPLGQTWFQAFLDLLLLDPQSASKLVSETASGLVRPLSQNKLTAVNLLPNGQIMMTNTQGQNVYWDDMPKAAQDIAYLALKGSVTLCMDPKNRVPFIGGEISKCVSGGINAAQIFYSSLAHAGQLVHLAQHASQAPQAKNTIAITS